MNNIQNNSNKLSKQYDSDRSSHDKDLNNPLTIERLTNSGHQFSLQENEHPQTKPKNKVQSYLDQYLKQSNQAPQSFSDDLFGGAINFITGNPAAGKTHLAVDLLAASAQAWQAGQQKPDWNGLEIEAAPCLILAFEGVDTHSRTVAAMQQTNGLYTLNMAGMDLLTNRAYITEAINRINEEQGHPPAFIVLDNWAEARPGRDENEVKDATSYLAPIREIAKKTNTKWIIIGHPSKHQGQNENPKDWMRGSGYMQAAAEAAIFVKKSEGIHIATVVKTRHTNKGDWRFRFKLEERNIVTEDKQTVTIPVVRGLGNWTPPDDAINQTHPLADNHRLALHQLDQLLETPIILNEDICPNGLGIKLEDWRKTFYKDYTGNNPAQAFKRLYEALLAKGLIGQRKHKDVTYIWKIKQARR